MPKKSRSYGTQSIKPAAYSILQIKKNGTRYTDYSGNPAAYNRRLGESAVLIYQTGRDGRFRPCSHTRERYFVTPIGSTYSTQKSYYPEGTSPTSVIYQEAYNSFVGVHGLKYSQFTSAVGSINTSLASVDWTGLAAAATQAMLPSFHTQNSLVNFILELKDFKDVVKYISGGFRQKLSRLDTFIARDRKGSRNAFQRDPDKGKPLKWLAKRYLSYEFGWRPFLDDLNALYKTIANFEERYRMLVRDANKPVQKHWGTRISGTSSSDTVYYQDLTGINSSSWIGSFLNRIRSRVTLIGNDGLGYHATMRLRYQIPPELTAAGGRAKAWLDTLGVSRNPAVLWNAIPFSFLIDWVVNVSGYLERLRLDNIQFKTEISDFCHSVKLEKQVNLELSANNRNFDGSYSWSDWVITDGCIVSNYQRKVGLPNFLLAIQSSGLNIREFALGSALAAVRKGA